VFKFTVARLCFSLKTAFAFGPSSLPGWMKTKPSWLGVRLACGLRQGHPKRRGMDAAASRQDDALALF
jgi:hypothetical protein